VTGALHGIKVVDLTRVLAGPLCTMMLGDLGADVIKVEPPTGDETRGWGPPYAGGESAYYLGVNSNKRGIALDLSTPDGQEVLSRMLASADIVVDNYRVGTMERWGFNETWFNVHAPRVVRCSITGYGTDGPRSDEPGYDFILQAETGLMSITGLDEQPTKHGVAIVDILTGHHAVVAVLAALRVRDTTQHGQQVRVSLLQSGLSLLANVASNFLISGKEPNRYGNGHPNIVPYRTFDTLDDPVALAVGNDGQFRRLAIIAGSPGWADDVRLRTNDARVRNRQYADGLVAKVFAQHTSAWWVKRLRAAKIPCGPVNDVPTALADSQVDALRGLAAFEHPTAGIVNRLASPLTLETTPVTLRRPPPMFGQHTDEVLAELGYSESQRRHLRSNGTLGAVNDELP